MTSISIVGGGWRTEVWLRLLRILKSEYELKTIYCRNQEKAAKIAAEYGVNARTDYTEIFTEKPDVALICVSKDSNVEISREIASYNINALCETPYNSFDTTKDKNIRVAEQYVMQPRFVVLKKIIDSGILGKIQSVELSCCHDYHAIGVMRNLLCSGEVFPDKIKTISLNDSYTETRYRYGDIQKELRSHIRCISFLKYGQKTGIYDFSEGQYFSSIRRHRYAIYGENGQIIDGKGLYLNDDGKEIMINIESHHNGTNGSLFPLSLKNITINGEICYENPYGYARLSEEEIAMAECLKSAVTYFQIGSGGYSPRDAKIDFITSENIKKEMKAL